jgi:DNA-directed RNA polymerase specialized sigma24 family protein
MDARRAALAEIALPLKPNAAGGEADQCEQERRVRAAMRAVRSQVSSQTWDAFSRVDRAEKAADVAQELGVSANTVHSACRRVRALLRKVLELL